MTWARHASPVDEHGWSATARAEEQVRLDAQAGRAMITVAGHATDATECRELLEMLGLAPGGMRRE